MSDFDITPVATVPAPPPPFDSTLAGAPGAGGVSTESDPAVPISGDEAPADLSRWDSEGQTASEPASTTPTPTPVAKTDESGSTAPSQADQIVPGAAEDEDARHVAILFRDGLDLPIEHLEITIPLPDGSMFTAKTGSNGDVTIPVAASASGTVPVKVKDVTGSLQQVCSIDLAKCDNAAIVRSPKVAAKGPLRQHQQTPPTLPPKKSNSPKASATAAAKPGASAPTAASAKPPTTGSTTWWGDNGALAHAWQWVRSEIGIGDQPPAAAPKSPVVQKALSPAGQPVTLIAGPECPNPDKLRLGRNNVFRQPIIDAAKRLGLIPQALCALMDCEAGKVTEHIPKLGPDGKQLKDKHGKPMTATLRELWNANAGNAQSGAAGLTQFLGSTWLGHVLIPGRYIHDQSVAKGWVKQETTKKGKTQWLFVLANGTTKTSVPKSDWSDANVRACLAMRMDPTWSINAAADYGAANLKVLETKGFKLGGLSDMNKAKLMYLMHHEGEGSGPLFIRNTLGTGSGGVEGLQRKFATQLGSDGTTLAASKIKAAGGDVEVAYRAWLSKFMDGNFAGTAKYFCSSPQECDLLSALMVTIGGEKIKTVD